MNRNSYFWGAALILVGAILLLANMGIITGSIWGVIWPLLLILLGGWVLIGLWLGPAEGEIQHASIPLEEARRAEVRIDYGAGTATLSGKTEPGVLMSGAFGGGVRTNTHRDGDTLHLRMQPPSNTIHMLLPWSSDRTWQFRLTEDIPLSIRMDGGAGRFFLDMSDLQVTDFRLEGGMGQATLNMPTAAGQTTARIEAGMGMLTIHIPEGVAARIKAKGVMGSLNIATNRFPKVGQHRYQSPNYEEAENKLDLTFKGGMGTLSIR